MLAVLTVTFPFFALVLCGYVATQARVLPLTAIGGLNSFVLFFALPCMLYRFGANTPIAQLLDPIVALIYLLCGLLVVAGAVAATVRRWGWNDAAFGALVTAFPNSGFMGVPLLVALLGPASAGPVIMTMALDMVVTTSLCIALSRLGLGNGSAGRALRLALKGVLVNPLPWSIGLGAVASAIRIILRTLASEAPTTPAIREPKSHLSKGKPQLRATAFAQSDFPQPATPTSRMPFGAGSP